MHRAEVNLQARLESDVLSAITTRATFSRLCCANPVERCNGCDRDKPRCCLRTLDERCRVLRHASVVSGMTLGRSSRYASIVPFFVAAKNVI